MKNISTFAEINNQVMQDDEVLKIDVEAVLKSKNPKLAKRLPKFLIQYLKKIVHQDEINLFLSKNVGITGLSFVDAVIEYMDLKYTVRGLDSLPENGKFVFASNHPLGGLESMVLMKAVSKKYVEFRFVVNDILMELKPLAELFVPVNKHGKQSRKSLNIINDVYASDKQVLFFPAGLVSRRIKGKIVDLPWQKSFVSKAVEYKRDIIPVYIEGRNSRFFYNLAKLRKFFRIKANIEMLFLVNEMMKQKGRSIEIVIGKPVSYNFFDKSKDFKEWADYLYKLTYSLKKELKNN
ncbi:MAG: 1-acyl-sn-glycerol-3-phosphate acyltransferase [Bacteroidales bacterium]|nr:1-acyl-sn-glycerol-3-phosphate acyltransferase [Bacteroidales bacterium]